MATVETALGPIDASKLGVTLSHEHTLVFVGGDNRAYPWMFDWGATHAALADELSEAKRGGVDTVIDLTTPDLGRDAAFVRELSRASGVNIVVATGIWLDVPRSFWTRDPDRIADIFVREIEVGIGDTGIKAGVIKVATDANGVTPEGERVLRGAARATKRTGCPISTHQVATAEVGMRQVEIFQDEGAPMDRICIGHCGATTDVAYLEALARAGVYLSLDGYPGGDYGPDWEQRNATLRAMIDRGWAHKIMLGHDHAPRPVVVGRPAPKRDGPTRYLFVTTVALPALRSAGLSDATIDLMMREVPRRFLSGTD